MGRLALAARYPELDFSACKEEWDYDQHSVEGATARAEGVRMALKEMTVMECYEEVVVVTHRGFAAFMVQGPVFANCGTSRFDVLVRVEN